MRERVHRIAVEEDVELDHVRGPELEELVVERRVALRDGLEPVVEVHHDLAQREVELDVHPLADVLERLVLAALLLGELVDLAHELGGHEDRAAHVGLLDALDPVRRRQLGGVLHLERLAPAVVITLKRTLGAVTIRERLNSRSSRSCTISRCSMPRKPQRNP